MTEHLTLAIDTSCDETSASVVRSLTALSNIMPSQMEFHKKFGGVVPSLAKLAHQDRIDNVVNQALKKAGVKIEDLDVIAVTYGPGLAMALEIGVNKAKELALKYKKPLIAINHMEGHLLSSFVQNNSVKKLETYNLKLITSFPALGVLVSGGHTELILVKDFGVYEKIGETLDDSCGEAYDKCGRILGLGYPAGPTISKFSKEHRDNVEITIFKRNLSTIVNVKNKQTGNIYQLPIAMANSGDLNFSYSGLKTAFKQLVEGMVNKKLTHQDEVAGVENSLSKDQILDLCVLIEAAALGQLTLKVQKAVKEYSPKEIWLGGGVVASARLRDLIRSICKEYNIKLRFPYSNKLTGDNAVMIGVAANIKLASLPLVSHSPENGIFLKDFQSIDREPSLSL